MSYTYYLRTDESTETNIISDNFYNKGIICVKEIATVTIQEPVEFFVSFGPNRAIYTIIDYLGNESLMFTHQNITSYGYIPLCTLDFPPKRTRKLPYI